MVSTFLHSEKGRVPGSAVLHQTPLALSYSLELSLTEHNTVCPYSVNKGLSPLLSAAPPRMIRATRIAPVCSSFLMVAPFQGKKGERGKKAFVDRFSNCAVRQRCKVTFIWKTQKLLQRERNKAGGGRDMLTVLPMFLTMNQNSGYTSPERSSAI